MLLLDQSDRAAIRNVVVGLEASWNKGSPSEYVRHFAVDADFVNIYGAHGIGRESIRHALDLVFSSTYAGSHVRYSLEKVRLLSSDVALAHVKALLKIPKGPQAGEMRALPSLVLHRDTDGWKIAAFHNTLIGNPDHQRDRRR